MLPAEHMFPSTHPANQERPPAPCLTKTSGASARVVSEQPKKAVVAKENVTAQSGKTKGFKIHSERELEDDERVCPSYECVAPTKEWCQTVVTGNSPHSTPTRKRRRRRKSVTTTTTVTSVAEQNGADQSQQKLAQTQRNVKNQMLGPLTHFRPPPGLLIQEKLHSRPPDHPKTGSMLGHRPDHHKNPGRQLDPSQTGKLQDSGRNPAKFVDHVRRPRGDTTFDGEAPQTGKGHRASGSSSPTKAINHGGVNCSVKENT